MDEDELCFPKLLNFSCKKLKRSRSETLIILSILCFISLTTVFLNLLVIISISHFRQLHTPTNHLLLSLAVSDFCVGILLFFQILLIDGCWYFGDIMCMLYCTFDYIVTSASIGNMVLISIDRYVAISDPLHYPIKVTLKRVQVCVSLCWTCSLFYVTILLIDSLKQPSTFKSCTGECVFDANLAKQVADLLLTFVIPFTVIIVLYLRVFVVVVSQVQAMRSHIAPVSHRCPGLSSEKVIVKPSELKAARTLGVVVVVFLICLCPLFCVILTGQDIVLNTTSVLFLLCLFYFNSCLNPLIYALFYPWFRKAIYVIVSLQVIKSGSSDVNLL